MRRILEAIVLVLVTALVSKAIEKIPNVQWLWQSFFLELWPLWLAVSIGAVYWLARDYMDLRRSVKRLAVEPHNREVYFQSLSDIARALEGRITKIENKASTW